MRIRRLATAALAAAEVEALSRLMELAFAGDEDGFTDEDWQHALGGIHLVLDLDGLIVSHAAVVQRTLWIAGLPLRVGYVEAVATLPALQGAGHGTRVMREVAWILDEEAFELGALGTGRQGFYQRLGWRVWRGPSSVRTPDGEHPTPDEDGFIMVLPTARSPELDLDAPISCDWRSGDVW